jgi:hypothetical protein
LQQVHTPLPPVDTLTFDSDFRAFLQPHVGEDLKRQARRKLLHDPRFNVIDGLDVYIEDSSTPSPLEPAIAAGLAQARYIFDPPPTRVNAQGHVEDVPAEAESADGEVAARSDLPPAAASASRLNADCELPPAAASAFRLNADSELPPAAASAAPPDADNVDTRGSAR